MERVPFSEMVPCLLLPDQRSLSWALQANHWEDACGTETHGDIKLKVENLDLPLCVVLLKTIFLFCILLFDLESIFTYIICKMQIILSILKMRKELSDWSKVTQAILSPNSMLLFLNFSHSIIHSFIHSIYVSHLLTGTGGRFIMELMKLKH